MAEVTISNRGVISFFHNFNVQYPTREKRYEVALELADPMIDPSENLDRKIIAAAWGDNTRSLKRTAQYLYTLEKTVAANVGESVIVMRRGSAADIFNDEPELTKPVAFDLGQIAIPDLPHGVFGNQGAKGQTRFGIHPPHLVFNTEIGVEDGARRIALDVVGDAEFQTIEPKFDNGTRLVAQIGAVTLNPDIMQYQVSMTKREVIVGDEPCNAFMQALNKKCLGEFAVLS